MENREDGVDFADGNVTVSIRCGRKFYKSKWSSNLSARIFQNLNLTVLKGQIYGLLGPSGSGKTTILRCILGLVKLDYGTVVVRGRQPGTDESGVPGPEMGYMPQETCLIDTMTIGECFWYFGSLLGMSNADIKERTKFYTTLLQLPSSNRLTSLLSGGQGRRVSFALALFHHPKLIILDEPTVGIDPITKDSIWKHLIELTKKNRTTVILTTHYIEEAKAAHRVGFLHGGTMADEDETETILQRLNCSTLEEVYMKICHEPRVTTDHDGQREAEATKLVSHTMYESKKGIWSSDRNSEIRPNNRFKRPLCGELRLRWIPLKGLIIKNFLFLLRFPGGLVFTLLLPPLIVMIFTFSFVNLTASLLNVYNEDDGQLANNFLSRLNTDIVEMAPTTSLGSAKLNLFNHDVDGVIHIHPNFSTLLQQRFLLGPLAGEKLLKTKLATVSIDNMVMVNNIRLKAHVVNQFLEFLKSVNNDSSIYNSAIVFNEGVQNLLESFDLKSSLHAIFTTGVFFAAAAGTVMLLFVELQKGYLERTFVAGVSSAEVLLGMMVAQLAVVGLQNIITVTTMYFLYNDIMVGDWFLVLLLYFSISFSGSMFGIFLSIMTPHSFVIVLSGSFYLMATGVLNGVVTEIEAAPYYFQYFCKASPLFFPVHAELDILRRGSYLLDRNVFLGFMVSLIWSFLFLTLSIKKLMSLKTNK